MRYRRKLYLFSSALGEEEFQAAKQAVEEQCQVKISKNGNEVTVIGTSAHAATPYLGKNAGLAAVIFATKLSSIGAELKQDLEHLLELFPYGKTDGSGLGIKMEDKESKDLTCTLDIYAIDGEELRFTYDSRVPICATEENCVNTARKKCRSQGLPI